MRVAFALLFSGFCSALFYAVVFVEPRHYGQLLLMAAPVVVFLSLVLGSVLYVLMRKFGVEIGIVSTVIAGGALGATPGLFLIVIASSPSPHFPMPEALVEGNIRATIIFALFGALGGLVFSGMFRLLRLK